MHKQLAAISWRGVEQTRNANSTKVSPLKESHSVTYLCSKYDKSNKFHAAISLSQQQP
jgi:hypothetical protein